MKVEIPSKVIEVCDICHCDKSVYEKCVVCGRQYCMICRAIMPGCIRQPDVCSECGETESVIAVVNKFVKPLVSILERRNIALKQCKRKENKK
jgi:hypothetical protein